jgi:hypothetical protein
VSGCNALSANLLSHNQKLIKLQVIIAEAARDGSPSGKVLLDEWTNHVALEAILMIDDVVRDAEMLSDAAGIVDVVEGAAASGDLLGHAFVSSKTALVPELHGEADEVVALGAEHGCDGGGIYTARHGYRDCVSWHAMVFGS